eukprot:1112529-Rhodomonas_salina.1
MAIERASVRSAGLARCRSAIWRARAHSITCTRAGQAREEKSESERARKRERDRGCVCTTSPAAAPKH